MRLFCRLAPSGSLRGRDRNTTSAAHKAEHSVEHKFCANKSNGQ